MLTRALPDFLDVASFVINELKNVGVEASLKQVESAQWHPLQTRGDFQIGIEPTGIDPADPDANSYENYRCGSPRNYPRYFDEEMSPLLDQHSQDLHQARH